MKKLKDISNYHLGLGILTIFLQLVFSFSLWLFPIGLFLVAFSKYEEWIVGQMKSQFNRNTINRIFRNFKIVNIIAFIILQIILFNIIAEIQQKGIALDLIRSEPLLYFNVIVIVFAFFLFFMDDEIRKMKMDVK